MPSQYEKLAQDLVGPLQPWLAARTPIYLPWSQRVLNPFPLASSGGAICEQPQPWPVQILVFYCTVYVNTTNNGTNYWTIRLIDQAGSTLASFTTAAIAANTFTRFEVSGSGITQPGSTNTDLAITATATLSPGSIYIVPAVALLITG